MRRPGDRLVRRPGQNITEVLKNLVEAIQKPVQVGRQLTEFVRTLDRRAERQVRGSLASLFN